jgi:hypothetical protein
MFLNMFTFLNLRVCVQNMQNIRKLIEERFT